MKKQKEPTDILPDLMTLTGLSKKQIDAAMDELQRAGFIHVDSKLPGQTQITLCNLDLI